MKELERQKHAALYVQGKTSCQQALRKMIVVLSRPVTAIMFLLMLLPQPLPTNIIVINKAVKQLLILTVC